MESEGSNFTSARIGAIPALLRLPTVGELASEVETGLGGRWLDAFVRIEDPTTTAAVLRRMRVVQVRPASRSASRVAALGLPDRHNWPGASQVRARSSSLSSAVGR